MNLKHPCTKIETLKIISYAVFMGLTDIDLYSETWESLKTLFWAITVIVLRGVMLVGFPVTLPALYCFARHMQRGVIEKQEVSSKRMRDRIHKNGN